MELYEAQVPKKLYRRELATILWSVYVCTNAPVISNNELCQISSPSFHSQSSYHAEVVKLDQTAQVCPYLDPDMYQT